MHLLFYNIMNISIKHYIPYILTIAICILLCFGFEYSLKEQFYEKDIAIAKIITNDLLQMEKQIEKTLRNATIVLEDRLLVNPKPTQQQLSNLATELGVSSLSVYNGTTGRLEYTSRDSLTTRKEFFKTYSILEPWIANMKEKDVDVRYGSFMMSNVSGNEVFRKVVTSWNKKLNTFVTARYYGNDLQVILDNSINKELGILSIAIVSPSGAFISKNKNHVSEGNNIVSSEYSEDTRVRYLSNTMCITFSFGGEKHSQSAKKLGLTNEKGGYFYNISIDFSTKELNKTLWFIRIGSSLFALCICLVIYYIHKSIEYKQQLADKSTATEDKIIKLCNARLGEIRRYFTKGVKDNMRVHNMEKELPEDVVQVLHKMFKEVDEKDLLKFDASIFDDKE